MVESFQIWNAAAWSDGPTDNVNHKHIRKTQRVALEAAVLLLLAGMELAWWHVRGGDGGAQHRKDIVGLSASARACMLVHIHTLPTKSPHHSTQLRGRFSFAPRGSEAEDGAGLLKFALMCYAGARAALLAVGAGV